MKRNLGLKIRILAVVSFLSAMTYFNSFAMTLSDVQSHWSRDFVTPLVDQHIIGGYEDGTYRPDNAISRIEFITLTVKLLEREGIFHLDPSITPGTYWGQPYIDKAIELDLISEGEFDNYDAPITREEMASVAIHAFGKYKALGSSFITQEAIKDIKDYSKVTDAYKDPVLNAYMEGLLTGKPGGYFDPKGNATRGESAVVILKMIDDEIREPITIDDIPHIVTQYEVKVSTGHYEYQDIVLYAPLDYNGNRMPEILEFYQIAEEEYGNSPYNAGTGYNVVGEYLSMGTSYLTDVEYETANLIEDVENQQTNLYIELPRLAEKKSAPIHFTFFGINRENALDDYIKRYPKTWTYLMKMMFGTEGGKFLEGKMQECIDGKYTNPNYGTFRYDSITPINGRKFSISGSYSGMSVYFTQDVY